MRLAEVSSAALDFVRRTDFVDLLRRTDADVFHPATKTRLPLTEKEAGYMTAGNNAGNAALYGFSAATGPVGGVTTIVAGAAKVLGAARVMAVAAEHAPDDMDMASRLAFAKSLCFSGAENIVVGAVACIPVVGQVAAGVMAARSVGDAAVAVEPLLRANSQTD